MACCPSLSISMTRNGIKLFCKRTENFDQCVKELTGQSDLYDNRPVGIRKPIRIEVIPYAPKSY